MFCCLSRRHLSLSTAQLVWAAWKEDRGKRRPPILWVWWPAIPAARPPWLAPYWMDSQERRNQSTTAYRKGIPLAGLHLVTLQCEQWTRFLACCRDLEGLKSDRRCCFAVGPVWVWGSLGTVSLFRAAAPSGARVRALCSCLRHCPRKKTATLVHIRKHLTRAGQNPRGHSAGRHTVDLQRWTDANQPAHSDENLNWVTDLAFTYQGGPCHFWGASQLRRCRHHSLGHPSFCKPAATTSPCSLSSASCVRLQTKWKPEWGKRWRSGAAA